MRALDLTRSWGADNVAAAVLVRGERAALIGDPTRDFRWASVTKLLTALAVLVAVEEGAVELERAAGPPGSTVRHLLAHASGLPFEDGGNVLEPGVRRIYSNPGFVQLGEALVQDTGIGFDPYVRESVLQPLGMRSTRLEGSEPHGTAAAGAYGSLDDLLSLAAELQRPTLLAPETLAEATSTVFPGLDGVLPGFGRQRPNDWGLGFELRGMKSPHWTGRRNSPATFGHFGGAGTFLWVDPVAGIALACLTDRPFGPWAADAWPPFADAVLAEVSS